MTEPQLKVTGSYSLEFEPKFDPKDGTASYKDEMPFFHKAKSAHVIAERYNEYPKLLAETERLRVQVSALRNVLENVLCEFESCISGGAHMEGDLELVKTAKNILELTKPATRTEESPKIDYPIPYITKDDEERILWGIHLNAQQVTYLPAMSFKTFSALRDLERNLMGLYCAIDLWCLEYDNGNSTVFNYKPINYDK